MISYRLFALIEDSREGERDRDYHPAVRYKDEDFHAERPRTHYEILRHIAAVKRVKMKDLDAAYDKHQLHFGLKHMKTGKVTWGH